MTDETMSDHINSEYHTPMADFHTREAAKYRAKAEALEAKGKTKAAARMWKIVERNERKAAEHRAKFGG